MQAILDEAPADHFLIWHDLEAEPRAIEKSVPGVTTAFGSQDLETREQVIADFAEGRTRLLATKPVIAGSGTNLPKHCHRAVFLGVGFKFNDFVQSLHRLHRFKQLHRVRVDLVYSSAEAGVRKILEDKWQRHRDLVAEMTRIVREQASPVTPSREPSAGASASSAASWRDPDTG